MTLAEDTHFAAMDAALKQPTRATDGDPCIKCGNPIPGKTAWKLRDRHVCSSKCNANLVRQWKRGEIADNGELPGNPVFDELAAAEADRLPQKFGMSLLDMFPFKHGHWPKAGDVIERWDARTTYLPKDDPRFLHLAEFAYTDYLVAANLDTGYAGIHGIDEHGAPAMVLHPFIADASGVYRLDDGQLLPGGVYYATETISDVNPDGVEYTWRAHVFTAAPTPKLWTPARQALSESRHRATAARNAFAARLRAFGVVGEYEGTERVDPHTIYDAAGWVCGICGNPITKNLPYPDPMSASLDHVIPITRGGGHVKENLQASHLICNIQKGAREL